MRGALIREGGYTRSFTVIYEAVFSKIDAAISGSAHTTRNTYVQFLSDSVYSFHISGPQRSREAVFDAVGPLHDFCFSFKWNHANKGSEDFFLH